MGTPIESIVVYDLSTVRFRRGNGGTTMRMLAASGETLAVIDTLPSSTDSDAVFSCCEHALAAARPRRDGSRLRIGLYNPYTAQISYGAGVDCVVYGDQQPIALAHGGTVASFTYDGLDIGGRCVRLLEQTVAGVSRAFVDSGDRSER